MSNSALLPQATRVWWYDIDNHYHSITTSNEARATALFTALRKNGLRVGMKAVW